MNLKTFYFITKLHDRNGFTTFIKRWPFRTNLNLGQSYHFLVTVSYRVGRLAIGIKFTCYNHHQVLLSIGKLGSRLGPSFIVESLVKTSWPTLVDIQWRSHESCREVINQVACKVVWSLEKYPMSHGLWHWPLHVVTDSPFLQNTLKVNSRPTTEPVTCPISSTFWLLCSISTAVRYSPQNRFWSVWFMYSSEPCWLYQRPFKWQGAWSTEVGIDWSPLLFDGILLLARYFFLIFCRSFASPIVSKMANITTVLTRPILWDTMLYNSVKNSLHCNPMTTV